MNEQTLHVKTPDGVMDTFLAMPDGDGPFPPVVLYMDIWGMREQLRDIARFVAAEGFACAAPSLYYRFGNTHFDHRHPDGKTKSIFILSDEDRDKMLAYGSQLTDEMAVSDTAALIAHLRDVNGVSDGYAGCFGYCMGGRHVVRVAAALPESFRATASFHGTYLATDKPESPHLDAPRIEGEIYFGYGEKDSFTQPDVIAAVRQAFENSPAVYHETVHTDTDHGYAIPDRDVYNEEASGRDWQTVFDMFRRVL
ncbi:MAG: dienelactone hydrolase family protein [Alphaproteobacteria bacterium]